MFMLNGSKDNKVIKYFNLAWNNSSNNRCITEHNIDFNSTLKNADKILELKKNCKLKCVILGNALKDMSVSCVQIKIIN